MAVGSLPPFADAYVSRGPPPVEGALCPGGRHGVGECHRTQAGKSPEVAAHGKSSRNAAGGRERRPGHGQAPCPGTMEGDRGGSPLLDLRHLAHAGRQRVVGKVRANTLTAHPVALAVLRGALAVLFITLSVRARLCRHGHLLADTQSLRLRPRGHPMVRRGTANPYPFPWYRASLRKASSFSRSASLARSTVSRRTSMD